MRAQILSVPDGSVNGPGWTGLKQFRLTAFGGVSRSLEARRRRSARRTLDKSTGRQLLDGLKTFVAFSRNVTIGIKFKGQQVGKDCGIGWCPCLPYVEFVLALEGHFGNGEDSMKIVLVKAGSKDIGPDTCEAGICS
jgi:hypothetical protein